MKINKNMKIAASATADMEENTEDWPSAPPSICFEEWPFYATFLQQLGLKKTKDQGRDRLIPEGKKQMPPIESIAEAMQQIRKKEHLTSQEVISMLDYALRHTGPTYEIPSYLHQYMCKEAVKYAVLHRFNEAFGCSCTSLTELSYKINDHIAEANEIFQTIHLCDPAMGTGHILLSLLNEMIAVKSQLRILTDEEGNPLFRYKIAVSGSNLLVIDKRRFEVCTFKASDPEYLRIQKALWLEKRNIVENCLFGVDTNPLFVSICRLRLWASLLKHTCGNDPLPTTFMSSVVEGNIRCGDSLVSRFSVREDLNKALQSAGCSVSEYKNLVNRYKTASPENEKKRQRQMSLIQEELEQTGVWEGQHHEDLLKWQRTLATLNTPSLLDKNNPVFDHAVEWRYEFPALWTEAGDFQGFDVIVSYPENSLPQTDERMDIYKQLNYKTYKQAGDLSGLFYELGNKLLKPNGYMLYFIANRELKAAAADKVHQFLTEETNPLLMIRFDRIGAQGRNTQQNLMILQKAHNQYRMKSCRLKDDFDCRKTTLEDYLVQKATHATMMKAENNQTNTDSLPFVILSDLEKSIKRKLEQTGFPLDTWDIKMHSGIKTGCDEAFIINGRTKDEFILTDYKNIDIVRPLLLGKDIRRYTSEKSDLWLIYIPWHFPLLYDETIKTASERAEARFRLQYPVLYDHLTKYKEKLFFRDAAEVGVTFEWYALQHLGTNSERNDFRQQKIVWQRESPGYGFCLDYNGCTILDTTCFITGHHLKYLLGVLNSKLGRYMLRNSPRLPNGDVQVNPEQLEALKIPFPNIKIESEMISFVNKRTSDVHRAETEWFDYKIDWHVYEMYGLDEKEKEFIETNISYI
jgi:hypothetical protein